MKLLLSLSCLILIVSTPSFAQSDDVVAKEKELIDKINNTQENDEKAKFGQKLSDLFLYTDRIKAKKYAAESFPFAKASKDNLIKANGYFQRHIFVTRETDKSGFNENINLDSAQYFLSRADTLEQTNSIDNLQLQIYSARGTYFYNNGVMDSAVVHYQDALKVAKDLNNIKNICYLNYNISICHYVLENYEEAIVQSKESYSYASENDFPEIASGSLNLLGATYQIKDSLSLAKTYFSKALKLAEKSKDERAQRECNLTLGALHSELNQLDSAIIYLNKSLELTAGKDDPLIETQIYIQLANVASKNSQPQKARELFNKASQLNQKINRKELDYHLAIDISSMEYDNQNYKLAYEMLDAGRIKKDSFVSLENRAQFRELELKYDKANDAKRISLQQINLLNKEKSIRQLSSGFIISLLGLLAGFFFYRNVKKSKAIVQRELELKNIEVQNLENEKSILALASTLEGQETERARIARDLHDGLGGLLSSVKAHYSKIQHVMEKIESENLFIKAEEMLDNACDEVRRISHNLMPPLLQSHGLLPSIQGLATDYSSENLYISFEHRNIDNRLTPVQEIFIYRICQELLTNIYRHAKATKVEISLYGLESEVQLIVEDNGIGFNPEQIKAGLGLQSIKSRIEHLRGELGIESSSNSGTTISVSIPKHSNA